MTLHPKYTKMNMKLVPLSSYNSSRSSVKTFGSFQWEFLPIHPGQALMLDEKACQLLWLF